MICPHCNNESDSRVYKTVQCSDGVLRLRRCCNCGQSFKTTETIDLNKEKK